MPIAVRVRNHREFQRAAALIIATGAATAWVCAGSGAETRRLLFVVVTLVVTLAAHQQGRAFEVAAAFGVGGSGLAAVLWPSLQARGASLSGMAPWSFDPEGQAIGGALFGLVAALGLFLAHIGRSGPTGKPGMAMASTSSMSPAAQALVARAGRAHQRICAELAHDETPEGRALTNDANEIAEGLLDLAARAGQLRQCVAALQSEGTVRAAAEDASTPGRRGDGKSEGVPVDSSSPRVRALADLEAAADRLDDQVRTHVEALERTALELLGRRAGRIAEAAAALTPVSRQLVEGGEHLRAQTAAFAELDAPRATESRKGDAS
ncbi:MAG TPA: hypothetical protein VGG33_17275 [Polyangia bacterium]